MSKKTEFTNEELLNMTMELVAKRLTEESPHLCNAEHGFGVLEINYRFNAGPRVNDRFSVIRRSSEGIKVTFPTKKFDKVLLKNNINTLFYVVSQYLTMRIVPQGTLTFVFEGGVIIDCNVNNEGSYKDLERVGRPDFNLDDFLFGEDEEEENE